MSTETPLAPAEDLAKLSKTQFPNESDAYRRARTALLAEEIELRRHLARVAAQRRALPPGGEVTRDFRFIGVTGEVGLNDLFGAHDTLVVYNFMYGPQRKQPCPMCTAQMSSWDGAAPHLQQRVGLAMVGRSPIARLEQFAKDRGWRHLALYSDPSGDFTHTYAGDRHADIPAYTVFTRRDGIIRHFWSADGGPEIADPGQDPHNAPDMNPLWIILDTTPDGRGSDWYPKLRYD